VPRSPDGRIDVARGVASGGVDDRRRLIAAVASVYEKEPGDDGYRAQVGGLGVERAVEIPPDTKSMLRQVLRHHVRSEEIVLPS
jgi:hypothetical protein